jgi:hypothetical protein
VGRIIAIVLSVLLCLLLANAYIGYRVQEWYFDMYAGQDAGLLLAGYMAGHHGDWPRSWDDLRSVDVVALHDWGYGRSAGFEDIQRRIEIDFEFKPASFVPGQNQPDPHVARPRIQRWPAFMPENTGANQVDKTVARYLENPAQFSAMTQPAVRR